MTCCLTPTSEGRGRLIRTEMFGVIGCQRPAVKKTMNEDNLWKGE